MPRSRTRKKKTKNKKHKKTTKEVVDLGYMEVVRKGRNIFIRNKFTSEEHKQYIQQLKDNRPKVYVEIKEFIERVVTLINSYDKIFVLGGIASYGYNQILTNDNDDSSSETAIEYCQSICLATPNVNQGKKPTDKVLQEIYDLLVKIREYFVSYYSVEGVTEKYTELESVIRLNMILETIIIRGEGYMIHIKELFKEMFSPHDEFLEIKYGFKSTDIIETFEKLEEAFEWRVRLPNGELHPNRTPVFKKWMYENRSKIKREDVQNGNYLNEFVKSYPGLIVENNGVILYPLNGIDTYNQLYEIRHFNKTQRKVVESLSLKFGENQIFTQPEKYQYEILNKSNIFLNPIIEENNKHYLFAMNLGARNYFYLTQELIKKADSTYFNNSFLGNRVTKAKDEFIERKVKQLFNKMLPDVQFERNVFYNYKDDNIELKCAKSQDGRYELDIIGISEEATYLIEVKSGLISEEAKRGAIESIKTDLSSIVGNAICQSYRASRYITVNSNCEFETSDKRTVKPINKEKVFRISVSFSYVGTIITSLSKLQEFGVIDSNADFAWTINIFDLFPFVELIESEEQFIDYLQKRIPFYKNEKIAKADEMDMLGFYFADDFKIDKAHTKTTDLQLNGYHSDIDKYFNFRGKKPMKKVKANTQKHTHLQAHKS